jgi:outer membrane lipase/esterase
MKTRAAACAVALAALLGAPATDAVAYSSLYVFGDSLSDPGNNALVPAPFGGVDAAQVISGNSYIPNYAYSSGQFSNGNVWSYTVAASLGLTADPSRAGGTSYASGGARTSTEQFPAQHFPPSLTTQASTFLADHGNVAASDALYIVAGGGNNARDAVQAIAGGADLNQTIAAAAQQYATDVATIVGTLESRGAQHILVWNTPNIGLAPAVTSQGAQASFLGSTVSSFMNQALGLALAGNPGATIFDLYGLLTDMVTNPSKPAYQLTNVTDACGAAVNNCDPASALFWDGIHPTARGHQILAGAVLAVVAVPEPGTYLLMVFGLLAVGLSVQRRRA